MSNLLSGQTPASLQLAVLAEARTWLRTPFHHEARLKGEGVDCAQLLIAVYASAGAIPALTTEHYPPDWMLHRGERLFLEILERYADQVETPAPADVAMFHVGRQEAHGAIVTAWPRVIHAYAGERCVVESDVSTNLRLKERHAGFWRLKSLA